MAKQIVTMTEFTDDLTGGKAENTISFSLDGAAYEIDLSKANTRAFEKALKPYAMVSRIEGFEGMIMANEVTAEGEGN